MRIKDTVIRLIDYLIITMFGLSQLLLLILAASYFTEYLGWNNRVVGEISGAVFFLGCNLLLLFLTKTNLLLDKK